MVKTDTFEAALRLGLEQAKGIASLTCKKIMDSGIFSNAEVAKDEEDNNVFNVVYRDGREIHKLVYIAVESMEKIKGSLVDIGFDIGFYEDGERSEIKKCLEAAMAEYTKSIPRKAR